jgi:trehalose-phosphatase
LNDATRRRVTELAAARGPLLIATDLDGTLAPIVLNAPEARVSPFVVALLNRLTRVARVAVLTGRDLNTARRMIPSDAVIVVGSHGLEATFEGELLPGIDRVALAAALERVEEGVISRVPGSFVHIERKAISTAFHYRSAPGLEPALRGALATLPEGLRLREGRMVLEIVPDADGGKDRALLALVRHLRPRSLLVMGDDATDAAMFRAARDLREEGTTVLLVGVSGGHETPAEVLELADVMLESPEETRALLETLATALNA